MTELAVGMELFTCLSATRRFPDGLARSYFQQLIDGLKFCHDQGVAHRDLKPENILLDGDNILKIADFGLAGIFDGRQGSQSTMTTNLGSMVYKAPEVLAQSGAKTADNPTPRAATSGRRA